MKLICIGDNVVDCYLDEGICYPGGNAVNVAVGAKRCGSEKVGYIGVLGNDDKADHIVECLEKEGIDLERCRKVYALTSHPGVKLVDNDRVFVSSYRDSCQHAFKMRMTPYDMDYIKNEGYTVCHTSCYSFLEDELPTIKEHCSISFDFSGMKDDEYFKRVCPYLEYAFLSASELTDEEIEEMAKRIHSYGTKIIGMTRGGKGATFYDGKEFYTQGIIPTEVVDTMGAGDSFISAFLTSYEQNGKDMKKALEFAAQYASDSCRIRGGFGYPYPIGEMPQSTEN